MDQLVGPSVTQSSPLIGSAGLAEVGSSRTALDSFDRTVIGQTVVGEIRQTGPVPYPSRLSSCCT